MDSEVYRTTCVTDAMASSLTAAGEMCRSIAPEIAVLVGYGLLAICVLGIASGRSVSIRVGALALGVA